MMNAQLFASSPSRRQLLLASGLTLLVLIGCAQWAQSRMGQQLLPHSFCISASPPLLRLHLVSDGLIALAYMLIPWAMLRFVRRRKDVPFGWIAWVFGAFILACGLTHAIEVWTLYYPVYWYAGIAKAFTAAISLGTAWLIYKLTPLALALPSAAQLRAANDALQAEVELRRQAQAELTSAKSQLERVLSELSVEARLSAAVLDRFFDEAPLGLALLDEELRPIRINSRLPETTGRPAAQYLSGQSLNEPPDVPAVLLRAAQRARDEQASTTALEVTVALDGASRSLKCSIFPILVEPERRLVGVVMEDVSAERALERERSTALAVARDADRRKTEFLAVLAHELRNPLAPVRTAAAVLERTSLVHDERAARMIAIVQRQVGHMSRLIDDLLDVSRIERGNLEHHPVECDLGGIVRQVCHDHEPSLREAGIRLEIEADHALPVHGDPVRLAQAVGNYLHNAAKFAPHSDVLVRAVADDVAGTAVVSVNDSGEGIAPELLPRLFEPFVQGDQNLSRSKGGLGLGLSLARRLIEMHGGRVYALSDGPGQGATFALQVPLRRARGAAQDDQVSIGLGS